MGTIRDEASNQYVKICTLIPRQRSSMVGVQATVRWQVGAGNKDDLQEADGRVKLSGEEETAKALVGSQEKEPYFRRDDL